MLLRVLSYLNETPWALTPRALETMLAIADRSSEPEIEALSAKHGRPLENTGGRVDVRDGVAIFDVSGPLFRYANLFTHISGATSYEELATSLNEALENPNVKQILLNINSPGGEYDGVNELAGMIHTARERKPITAYIGGLGASGGYWLATAASRIVADESAFLGSIGVVARIYDSREAQAKGGIRQYSIVSSQSPRKNPDITTDEGRAQIQEQVDDAGALFVSKVALYRGRTTEEVRDRFGGGATMVARKALAAGMIDELGTFESTLRRLTNPQEVPMAAPAANENDIRQAARLEERQRIAAILLSEEAADRPAIAREIACTTDIDAETARRLLGKAPLEKPILAGPPERPKDRLDKAMESVPNPQVGTNAGEETSAVQQEVDSILAFVPKNRRQGGK